jgi:hypothetical protein
MKDMWTALAGLAVAQQIAQAAYQNLRSPFPSINSQTQSNIEQTTSKIANMLT